MGQQRTGDELKHFFTVIKNPDLYHEQWHTLHLKDDDSTSEYWYLSIYLKFKKPFYFLYSFIFVTNSSISIGQFWILK